MANSYNNSHQQKDFQNKYTTRTFVLQFDLIK